MSRRIVNYKVSFEPNGAEWKNPRDQEADFFKIEPEKVGHPRDRPVKVAPPARPALSVNCLLPAVRTTSRNLSQCVRAGTLCLLALQLP